MNFFKGIKSYIFGKDGERKSGDEDGGHGPSTSSSSREAGSSRAQRTTKPAHKRQATQPEPVLQDSLLSTGGVQGLSWYVAKQKQDEDGDLAEEFYVEAASGPGSHKVHSKKLKGLKGRKVRLEGVHSGNVVLSAPAS